MKAAVVSIIIATVLVVVFINFFGKDKEETEEQSQSSSSVSNPSSGGITRHCIGEWGEWGSCSHSCGGGKKTRTYTVTRSKLGNGQDCPHVTGDVDEEDCNVHDCGEDCQGVWVDSSEECSVNCGHGVKTRTYSIISEKTGNGAECTNNNNDVETIPCNLRDCSPCVGSWSGWDTCSELCGGGRQTRTYTITEVGEEGGQECEAEHGDNDTQDCNVADCVNCVGAFGPWSGCSATCGGGTEGRRYSISQIAAEGGTECPHQHNYLETRNCNTDPCPQPPCHVIQDRDRLVASGMAMNTAKREACSGATDIVDGSSAVHHHCKADADCSTGRCAGPTGDPGCYSAYTCTGARRPEDGGPPASVGGGRMGPCGMNTSVDGAP